MGFAHNQRNAKMEATDDKYFECPICGYYITFKYNDEKGIYTSFCPYCKETLEMDKEEFENNGEEIYFEKDW